MAIAVELQGFVKEGLERGHSRLQIEEVLIQAGWARDDVGNALAGFAEIEFPIPVPKPRPYLSAREAFLYLVLFSTLYISGFSFGGLLFQLINLGLPDPAVPPAAAEFVRDLMRSYISALIVAFPVFLFVARLTAVETRKDPTKRASKVRRWLTYLTLFVAAAVLIGDATTLVYSVLSGELTGRFILKVLTIACIAGSVFGYYLSDLRREEQEAGA